MLYPLVSLDEFRLIKSYTAFFPFGTTDDIPKLLNQYYRYTRINNSFLSQYASKAEFTVSNEQLTQQQVFFYGHWAGTRDMEIHYLKAGGKLTMLVDRESEETAVRLRWNQFFSSFGDFDYVVAEDPMCVRKILRAFKSGRSLGISLDGNRGSASRHLAMPASPFVNFRFPEGGLKLALRSGLPISYISSFVEDDTAYIDVSSVHGTNPGEIAASLLSLYGRDLKRVPFAWKLWHRAHKDHEIKNTTDGIWLAVEFLDEIYLGFTGNGQLIKLPPKYFTVHTNAKRYSVEIAEPEVIQNKIKAA